MAAESHAVRRLPAACAAPAVRVVLADGCALHRCALADALDAADGVSVVGVAVDGWEAVETVRRVRPDVVLADLELPGLDGVEACAAVKSTGTGVHVVLVSGTTDHDVLLAAVEAGVDGYVTKEAGLSVLVDAVRRVGRGEAVVPPLMLGGLLRSLIVRNRKADQAMRLFMRLTRRERDVLELLVDGCDHAAVADILVISPQTARTHIQNVIQKLEVHSRLEAAALAVEHGFFERLRVVRS